MNIVYIVYSDIGSLTQKNAKLNQVHPLRGGLPDGIGTLPADDSKRASLVGGNGDRPRDGLH